MKIKFLTIIAAIALFSCEAAENAADAVTDGAATVVDGAADMAGDAVTDSAAAVVDGAKDWAATVVDGAKTVVGDAKDAVSN